MELNVTPGSEILVQIETDLLGLDPALCLSGLQGCPSLQVSEPTGPLR